jgi:hypothetical protein
MWAHKKMAEAALASGFFFRGRLTVRLDLSSLFAGHVAGVLMKLAFGIFSGLLLIRIFVVSHRALL